MRAMVRLIPRTTKFFAMFSEMANNLTEGARLLKAILQDMKDVEARVEQLKTIEHRGDEMTHELLTKLNQTFITPFDREDIHKLASSLDDVLDFVHAAGERLVMYKIMSAPPAAVELADSARPWLTSKRRTMFSNTVSKLTASRTRRTAFRARP